MARRFIRGIEVSSETLARDVINRVGPGGHYLEEDHTYNHFRQQLWRPSLLTRHGREDWQEAGGMDLAQKIRNKVLEILNTHQASPLPDDVLSTIAKLREKGSAELSQ